MTELTAQHEQRTLAFELIRRKLRTPIVHLHTKLPLADIRDWHREMHGQSPSSGLLPSMSTLLPNRSSQIYVSLFAAIYGRIGGEKVLQEIDIHAFVEAWDLFDTLTAHVDRKRPADMTDAWVIARDLRTRSAQMHRCAKCFSPYLVADDCKLPPSCPVCYGLRQANNKHLTYSLVLAIGRYAVVFVNPIFTGIVGGPRLFPDCRRTCPKAIACSASLLQWLASGRQGRQRGNVAHITGHQLHQAGIPFLGGICVP